MIGALLGLDEFALELGRDAIVRAVKPTELAVLAEILGGEGLVHGESLLGELGELHLLDDFPLGSDVDGGGIRHRLAVAVVGAHVFHCCCFLDCMRCWRARSREAP